MRIVAVFGSLVALSLAVAAAACTTVIDPAPGGATDDDAGTGDETSTADDAGPTPIKDAGKKMDANIVLPDLMAAPQILNLGGSVMKTPRIVPIYYTGEPYLTQLNAFIGALPGSAYWTATTSEYGVGAVTVGASHTVTTPPPSNIDDSEIKTWLTTQLNGAWGPPDPNTIYTIYYPSGTNITLMGDASCSAFGGYHSEVTIGATRVVYAVMPRCSNGGNDLDYLTSASTHEFIEAVTDPHPFTGAAYNQPDDDHVVWALFPTSELADMCTFNTGADINPAEIGYAVQRTWSNKAAAGHHNPCVPAPAGQVYFNSVPILTETVTIDFGMGATGPTKGVAIPVGTSKTIDVTLFADGATGPWTVEAVDYVQYMQQGSPDLSFTFNKTQGSAGDTLKLTITRNVAGQYGGSAFIISSAQGASNQNLWVGFAGN